MEEIFTPSLFQYLYFSVFIYRFGEEQPVDQAVLLSGWRLKVDNQSEHPYTSKLHVDYAQVNTFLKLKLFYD